MATPDYKQYLTEAEGVYDPLYKGKEAEVTNQYETGLKSFAENVRNEFNARGLLNSGLYGEAYSTGQKDLEAKKGSALSDLMMRRIASIQDYASGRYRDALSAWEKEQAAELARQEAAQAAAARQYSSSRSTGNARYTQPNEAYYKQANQQNYAAGLAGLGDYMMTTGATREAAASQLAADTGMKYADVLKQVYANYGNGWELNHYKNMKSRGVYKPGLINKRYSKIIAQQLV